MAPWGQAEIWQSPCGCGCCWLWVRSPQSSYPALTQHGVGQEGTSPGVLVDTHPECPGTAKNLPGQQK